MISSASITQLKVRFYGYNLQILIKVSTRQSATDGEGVYAMTYFNKCL